jgi:hypothetical protein
VLYECSCIAFKPFSKNFLSLAQTLLFHLATCLFSLFKAQKNMPGLTASQLARFVAQLESEGGQAFALDLLKNLGKKKAKRVSNDDPDRVKRPVPASWMFRDENRASIVEEHFGGKSPKGSAVSKKAKELWDAMSEDDRAPYETRRAELWAAYKAANPGGGSSEPKVRFTVASCEGLDVPDGWNGPFTGKFCQSLAAGGKRGVGKFETFEDAVKAASELETCGGITFDPKRGYSLRVGNDPITQQWVEGGDSWVSWTKKDHVMVVPEKKKRKKKGSGSGSGSDTSSDEADADLQNVDFSELEGTKVLTNDELDADAAKASASAEPDAVFDAETDGEEEEQEDESEDESDDEETDVVEWEYKGKTYYVNEESNEVFDESAAEDEDPKPIGKRVKGKKGAWVLKKTK